MSQPREIVYTSLATSLEAGVPLLKTLDMSSHVKSSLKSSILFWLQHLQQGQDFLHVVAKDPYLPEFDKHMIQCGLKTGRLDQTFNNLSSFYLQHRQNKRTFTTNLAKPLIVYHIACLVIPLMTYLLNQLSTIQYVVQVLKGMALLDVPLLVGPTVLFAFRKKSDVFDNIILGIPILGSALKKLYWGRFTTTLGWSLESGVPMLEALHLAENTVTSRKLRNSLKAGLKKILEGHSATSAFNKDIPEELALIWDNGYASGQLDSALKQYGEIQTREAYREFRQLTTWLPRLLYFGIMIFLVYSIFKIALSQWA